MVNYITSLQEIHVFYRFCGIFAKKIHAQRRGFLLGFNLPFAPVPGVICKNQIIHIPADRFLCQYHICILLSSSVWLYYTKLLPFFQDHNCIIYIKYMHYFCTVCNFCVKFHCCPLKICQRPVKNARKPAESASFSDGSLYIFSLAKPRVSMVY